MAKRARVYWDACTWLAIVNEERAVFKGEGKPTENRFAMCKNIIDRAEKDEFEIVVSAFTLAEVCKSNEAKTENLSRLPFFLDHDFVLMVLLDKDVGLKAQALQTSGLVGLKPADAVHLASAQRANALEFHTFDGALLKLSGQIASNNGSQKQMSDYCKYDDLGYRPSSGRVDVGNFSIPVTVETGRAMEADGHPVMWPYSSIPVWAADNGLAPFWVFFERVWSWPSRWFQK